MGECSKDLSPHYTKVLDAPLTGEFGEDSVEDVSEQMAEETEHDCWTSQVTTGGHQYDSRKQLTTGHSQVVGDVAEHIRHGDLNEETDRGEGVTGQWSETKAGNDGGGVCVECSLRAVVAEGDEEVDP